jgi:hypothetical protein
MHMRELHPLELPLTLLWALSARTTGSSLLRAALGLLYEVAGDQKGTGWDKCGQQLEAGGAHMRNSAEIPAAAGAVRSRRDAVG